MKLSSRELRLLMITITISLLGLGWWIVDSQLALRKELKQEINRSELQLLRAKKDLRERTAAQTDMERLRAQLPRHELNRDLNADLSRQVKALAAESGLRLTGLTPEPEEELTNLGLHQSALRCSWTGAPGNLLGFLLRLEQLGAVADVRELRIRAGRPGEDLKGSFMLDFAYTRVEESSASPAELNTIAL